MSGSEAFEDVHINLSGRLSFHERLVRRVLCARWASGNRDLARWRMELNMGWLARRRIRMIEAAQGPFSVFHLHPQPLAYCLLHRMRQTPAIVSIDATQHLPQSEAPPSEAWSFRPGFWHDQAVFAAARTIVCTSRWAADHVRSLETRFEAKTRVLPYPVDAGKFPARWLADRLERAAQEGYKPVLLFVGGDFHRKGGADLLEAWKRTKLWERATLVVMTGTRLDQPSLPPGIRLLSGVNAYSEQWFKAWNEADVFTLPTRSEAFGMVLQEAAAAGLPVVSTAVQAIPEIVLNDRTGILIKPRDVDALANALSKLVGSAQLRLQLGASGREHMEKLCHPLGYRSALLDLIHGALN